MTCNCLDEQGALRESCLGICKDKIFTQVNQERDIVLQCTELLSGQLHAIVDGKLAEFKFKLNDERLAAYKEAFLDGIKEGLKIGREDY